MPNDLYKQITAQIIQQIERGEAPPWRRPWMDQVPAIPHNFASKRPFQGINCLILWDIAATNGYSNRWASYRQWQALGYQVRQGESGTRIYFWRECDGQRIVREHVVFAAEQCIDEQGHRVLPPLQKSPFINYQPAERVIAATQADVHFGGNRAYYSVEHDIIVLPYKPCFDNPGRFYSTALHELAHWTGHPTRLNRFSQTAPVGSCEYGYEELVGEIASAFLTAQLNIPNVAAETHSASYLASWLPTVKADSRAIVRASSDASRAADYVLSLSTLGQRKSSIAVEPTEV